MLVFSDHPMWESTTGSSLILEVDKPEGLYRQMSITVHSISKPFVYKIIICKGSKSYEPVYTRLFGTLSIIEDWVKHYKKYVTVEFYPTTDYTHWFQTRIDPNCSFQLSPETSSDNSSDTSPRDMSDTSPRDTNNLGNTNNNTKPKIPSIELQDVPLPSRQKSLSSRVSRLDRSWDRIRKFHPRKTQSCRSSPLTSPDPSPRGRSWFKRRSGSPTKSSPRSDSDDSPRTPRLLRLVSEKLTKSSRRIHW